jgi:hypothetical protein
MAFERFAHGRLRWQAPGGGLQLVRLAPAALLLQVWGDAGCALDPGLFAELERELSRFALPLRLFADLRRAGPPGDEVREAWTGWLRTRRARLGRFLILAPAPVSALAVQVVRRLSASERVVHLAQDAAGFRRGLEAVGAGLGSRWAACSEPEPPPPEARCAWSFDRPASGVLRVVVTGHDAGQLGTQPLDELMRRQAELPARVLFVDARGVTAVAPSVREHWVAWIRAHAAGFAALSLLAGSPLVRLTFALAREESRAGQRMRIHADAASFRDDLERESRPA